MVRRLSNEEGYVVKAKEAVETEINSGRNDKTEIRKLKIKYNQELAKYNAAHKDQSTAFSTMYKPYDV